MKNNHVLSENVKAICRENYEKNCGICGLRPSCIKNPLLTQENHNKWILELNRLAENLGGKNIEI